MPCADQPAAPLAFGRARLVDEGDVRRGQAVLHRPPPRPRRASCCGAGAEQPPPGHRRERHRDLQLGIILPAGALQGVGPAVVEDIFALAVASSDRPARRRASAPSRPRPVIGAGVQPVPAPTLPDSSSAARKAWLRNGSPRRPARPTPPASSAATPGAMRAIDLGFHGRPSASQMSASA